MTKPPLITIVGPNASGKTSLSISLAKKFNGEVISADSRQVYRGMDIGTGKATRREQRIIKHYLLDVADPNRDFNVAHFKKKATRAIEQILAKGKLPFLVGGTGFWIRSIIDNLDLPAVKPNVTLRRRLGQKTASELFLMLKKLDPVRARTIDRHNPYRLIRAIEIIKTTGKKVPALKKSSPYRVVLLGVTHSLPNLYARIDRRLSQRLKQGLVKEVSRLHRQGVSWRRMHDIGLEYRYVSLYLRGKMNKPDMVAQLKNAIHHYAKRQITWFRPDSRIHWITTQKQAEKLINNHLRT
ncbi:MAG: tRNA (adenosine(37)-N6)-dimethylallyltransferase MiaA [Patescibacteria group bacterium]